MSIILLFISFPIAPSSSSAATTIIVEATQPYQPGYYWCQHSDGHWSTDSTIDGIKTAPDDGSEPQKTMVKTSVTTAVPSTKKWQDKNTGKSYDFSQVTNPKPVAVEMQPIADSAVQGNHYIQSDKVVIWGYSGKGVLGEADSSICNGNPGMKYPFPITVTFQGTVTVTDQLLSLEIDPTQKTLNVGESQHFTVYANWDRNGIRSKEVVPDTELLWSSDAPAKAAVDSGGTVMGAAATPGTTFATINALYSSQNQSVSAQVKVVDPGSGTIFIRHMSKSSATGAYALQKENLIDVPSLPDARTVSADSSYGTIIGHSLSYSTYIDTPSAGSTVNTSLTGSSQKYAYVTFFYQNDTSFSGEFDVVPGSIKFRDSFTLHPRDFQLGSCTYISHQYKIERSGTFTSAPVYGQFADTTYTYGSYPWNIGVGTHMVSMQITTSCGTSSWIGPKTLTVENPAGNNPPTFQVGFVNPGNPTVPLHQVVQGTKLDLIYINDPSVPTPNDPDGDTISFNGFDLSTGTNFVKSIPSNGLQYVDGWHNITMDTPGFHHVTGMMSDMWGAASTASTWIEVVPPNPIPVADCPAAVVEGHPVSYSLYNAGRSYSPIGIAIDHSKDEWIDRLPSYPNGTASNITVNVGLHVYDSTGLKSLQPGSCSIIVKPDMPPAAKLDVPSVGIRNTTVGLFNKSTSPDGDTIVQAEYKFKYDANNNGFADETWQNLAGDLTKATFTPTKVGKYLFYLKVTENYGKWGDTGTTSDSVMTLDVINDAPEVSFDMAGNNTQPDLNAFATDTAASIFNWPLYETNSTKPLAVPGSNIWKVSANKLVSGEGRAFGASDLFAYSVSQTKYGNSKDTHEGFMMQNNGFGTNRLSPWRSASTLSTALSGPLIDPKTESAFQFSGWTANALTMKSNKKLFYFSYPGYNSVPTIIYAVNPKKLTPVEQFYKPYAWYPSYRYTGGSPYEFQLQLAGTPSKRTSDGITWYCDYIDAHFELGEKYLYVRRAWNGYDGVNTLSYGEIAVFDAFTGTEMASTFNFPDYRSRKIGNLKYTKGSNLVMSISSSGGSQEFVEVTPQLSVVRDVFTPVPAPNVDAGLINSGNASGNPYVYRFSDPIVTDEKGAIYQYQWYWPNNGSTRASADLNITKYNPDFSLAWRVYLKPYVSGGDASSLPYPSYGGTFLGSAYSYTDDTALPAVDPIGNEVLVKYYYDYYAPGTVMPDAHGRIAVIDKTTGGVKYVKDQADADYNMYWFGNPNYADIGSNNYSFSWDGRKATPNSTYTVEGNRTTWRSAGGSCEGQSNTNGAISGYNEVVNSSGGLVGYAGVPCRFGYQILGEYVQDGVYVSMTSAVSGRQDIMSINLSVGTPTTTPKVAKSYTDGQFVSAGSMDNAEVKFSFSMDDVDYDSEWLGFSFRMQDPKNRYSVETNGSVVELVKYIGGARTVLRSASYPMQDKNTYNVRLKFIGSQIDVWLNGIPILNGNDTTYTVGKYGYWGDKSFITFSDIKRKALAAAQTWSSQFAIWDNGTAAAQVKYSNITFIDPENDPLAGSFQWTIKHTPRFINNQGLSMKEGQTFNSQQLTLDKVGDYDVTLRAKDDPNPSYLMPSMVFDAYRKPSNPFTRKVTVHRRPISDYTVVQDAITKKVIWTDRSLDPDRYESAAKYSTEPTGIDYLATKGVMEKKFYYISPSGVYSPTKLVSPTESGTYEVGLAVRDEYDAWSDYNVQYVAIGTLPPPNKPPIPGFTASPAFTVRGVNVTINSTASDPEDGERTNLVHTYYIRNLTGGAETVASTSRTSWTKIFSSVGTFRIRQVVEDSEGSAAETTRDLIVNNRLPSASVTVPASTSAVSAVRFLSLRPTFQWTYSDPDADTQASFQVLILNNSAGATVHDTGTKSGSYTSWTPPADLPENVTMSIQVRVNDGFEWSPYSSKKYFYIETNRPPTVDFDWSPKPVYEGDSLTLLPNAVDPDGDPLRYSWSITGPAGYAKTSVAQSPVLKVLSPGDYSVTLSVSDGKADAALTKRITVLPLTITAGVAHTEAWRQYHREAGHETISDPKDFYAGERFVVYVLTAAAPVNRVDAALHANDMTNRPLDTDIELAPTEQPNRYAGELWDSRWSSITQGLPKGVHLVRFTVTYANGVVKQTDIPVRIIGSILKAVSVHRQQ